MANGKVHTLPIFRCHNLMTNSHSALAVSIGQNIFLSRLGTAIATRGITISKNALLVAGAGGLKEIAGNGDMLRQLKKAYADAIWGPLVVGLVATCAAFPFGLGMEWLNIKTVAEDRKRASAEEMGETREIKGPQNTTANEDEVEPAGTELVHLRS